MSIKLRRFLPVMSLLSSSEIMILHVHALKIKIITHTCIYPKFKHTCTCNAGILICDIGTFLYRTPLMASVGNGFVDCVNLLLAEGANVQALDIYHRSALHRAVSSRVQAAVTLSPVFQVVATCCVKWRGV